LSKEANPFVLLLILATKGDDGIDARYVQEEWGWTPSETDLFLDEWMERFSGVVVFYEGRYYLRGHEPKEAV